MVTREEHIALLRKHDWSYFMSDDSRAYNAGASNEGLLLNNEKNNPELKGMHETYHRWYWGLAEGSNTIDSGPGRRSGAPEPFSE